MTTKEQERKALAQIREIVESLGEGSYIATAFEGCFEIAEENINNDFACSMKQRVETAEAKLAHAEKLAEEKAQKAKYMGDQLQSAYDRINELWEQLQNAEKKQLTKELYRRAWTMAYDQAEAGKALILHAADIMADLADTPTDIAFQDAVKLCRKSKQDVKEGEWIMENLDKIKPAGC